MKPQLEKLEHDHRDVATAKIIAVILFVIFSSVAYVRIESRLLEIQRRVGKCPDTEAQLDKVRDDIREVKYLLRDSLERRLRQSLEQIKQEPL